MIRPILLLIVVAMLSLCSGCTQEHLPDSMTIGYAQEQYRSQSSAWRGGSVSFTWNFK